MLLLALLPALAYADSPTIIGIYGTTLRIRGGIHDAGANIECYSYLEGTALSYVACFDWAGGPPKYIAGPNCYEDALKNDVVVCNTEEHPITALDVRFSDNPTPNSLAWSGSLPGITKLSVRGSHGEDQFGGPVVTGLTPLLPDLLGAKFIKKSGTWQLP